MKRSLNLIPRHARKNMSGQSTKISRMMSAEQQTSDYSGVTLINNNDDNVLEIAVPNPFFNPTTSGFFGPDTTQDDYAYQMFGHYSNPNDNENESKVNEIHNNDGEDPSNTTINKPASTDSANTKISGDVAGAIDVPDDTDTIDGIETSEQPVNNNSAWDPRLIRVDGFITDSLLIPFSSETASSAYYDHLFAIEQLAIDIAPTPDVSENPSPVTSGSAGGDSTNTESLKKKANKVAPNKAQVAELKKDGDMYGAQSLVNPYCVTRLMGGLNVSNDGDDVTTFMYDVRDRKRFYDNAGRSGDHTTGIVAKADDFTSINNPTTDNIIKWSNGDKWGRTPYSFQDFVFCKYWNIIPNNRLITLRKYAVPTLDNLNFTTMVDEENVPQKNYASPIATVVTYFGGETGNTLSDIMKFDAGTPWKEIPSDVHDVTGDTGSNPHAVIDSMFEGGNYTSGGFGGQTSASSIVNSFMSKFGGLTADYLSFGKFVGLLHSDGYNGHSQEAWENLTRANMDPRESIYANRIVGPVNRVKAVQARADGIDFSQSFNITCEYVARPIGGINTKAAILDILANCMEIAAVDAVWWGGGYKFNIKPHMYPFRGTKGRNSMMDDLYRGKIFGSDGAIAHSMEGMLNFGKKNGSFEWSNITEKLGEVFGQTVGALGNLLQSLSSTLFGESNALSNLIKKGTDMLSTDGQQAAGSSKLKNFTDNVNKMWQDRVITKTTMPSLSGMRSILCGEPTGNWHLTVGNPLNPIMVVGNLICKKMSVSWSEELGPDDFPMSMKVVYTLEHAMARDKASIQSMFNRGAGKIYKLPDYIRATSDYESTVDDYTGDNNKDLDGNGSWTTPKYMNAGTVMSMTKARGYQTYKIDPGHELKTHGNPATTKLTVFTPVDPQVAGGKLRAEATQTAWLNKDNGSVRSRFFANLFTRKYDHP